MLVLFCMFLGSSYFISFTVFMWVQPWYGASRKPYSYYHSPFHVNSEEGKVRKVLKVEPTPDGNGRFFNLSMQFPTHYYVFWYYQPLCSQTYQMTIIDVRCPESSSQCRREHLHPYNQGRVCCHCINFQCKQNALFNDQLMLFFNCYSL